jgi:serpin B
MKKFSHFLLYALIFFVYCCAPHKVISNEKLNSQNTSHINDSVLFNFFTFNLFNKLDNNSQNIIVSPVSISTSIAMTYLGAENNTKKQIAKVFGFDANKQEFLKKWKNINDGLQNDSSLQLANSVWIDENYVIKNEYSQALTSTFNNSIFKINFSAKPEIKVNDWISSKTSGNINEIIAPGIIDNLTKLLLVNAIHFKSDWKYPFSSNDIVNDKFYISPENAINTAYLYKKEQYNYFENTDIQAISIPYKNPKYSLLIILPKNIDQNPVIYANSALFSKITTQLSQTEIKLYIPKFKAESAFELNNTLAQLGMPEAFSQKADFSGISGKTDLYISNVLHKAYIEVNEKGTEASAATVTVMKLKSAPVNKEIKIFKASHPFVYLILNNQTNTILFIGKLNNPLI